MHQYDHPGGALQRVRRLHTAIPRPPKWGWGFSFPHITPDMEDHYGEEPGFRATSSPIPPEAELLLAVVTQAWLDAVELDYVPTRPPRSANAKAQVRTRALERDLNRREARDWFASTRADEPTDFASICEALDLNADRIRRALARAISTTADETRGAA